MFLKSVLQVCQILSSVISESGLHVSTNDQYGNLPFVYQEAELDEREREREMERFRQQIIEEERQKLLRAHAEKLIGYLPKVKC